MDQKKQEETNESARTCCTRMTRSPFGPQHVAPSTSTDRQLVPPTNHIRIISSQPMTGSPLILQVTFTQIRKQTSTPGPFFVFFC
ncbi:hypothetical protein BCR43DRAFT_364518 [Syncephalastrum racemosum]|uniref:Uncharacterized protein n=1 Tax=Syncephalastrum racemosum TaxID=13706 RepID=A0A1X2H3W5_SYNRA|nr:hypothetical protein BCR43DRAFT_364518 [Syncephalastrum racemosum]